MPHGTAATFAVENAGGVDMATGANDGYSSGPTDLSRLVRNLVYGAEFMMSPPTHFYALAALDLVQGPGMAPWTPYWADTYYDPALRAGGAPNNNLSWNGSGGPENIYTAVITDYVLALRTRNVIMSLGAIFGGRAPIQSAYVAGGVTTRPTQADITNARELLFGTSGGLGGGIVAGSIADFVVNHYIPMTEIVSVLHGIADNSNNQWGTLSGTNPNLAKATRGPLWGNGLDLGSGCGNFMSFGAFDGSTSGVNSARLLKRGVINGASAGASGALNVLDPMLIHEFVDSSHYDPSCSGHPLNGSTVPVLSAGYTFHKAPRYPNDGAASSVVEVGPLARMWVNGDYRWETGSTSYAASDHAFSASGRPWGDLSGSPTTGAPLPALGTIGVDIKYGVSVMDRHRARAKEALKVAVAYDGWLTEVENMLVGGETPSGLNYDANAGTNFTGSTSGMGLSEAPRGAVSHYIRQTDTKINNYQIIAPTTWNASGTDANANKGPIEQALMNAPVFGIESNGKEIPVVALAIIHSFDPCIACSIHMIDPKDKKKVLVYEEGGVER